MFSITVPNVDLPVDLGFTQDFDLKLAIGDDGDVVVCGRHWTLFTTVTQPMADFEAAYGILQQTAMVSCAAAAAAEPPPLDIDDSCMPFDKLTYAVVVALEELVDNSCCPNTRVFAWLYAKHLRAADMDFMDLLQTPAIANMASTALDAWFVRHPMFRAQAHEAQDLLITVLDDYTPSRPRYEPYWDFDLKLAIGDDGDVVVCGRHWTLFTTVTQPMADFEAAYGIMQQTAMVSCAAAAAAEPPPLDIGVKDAMLIPDVIKDNWYKGDYGLGQVAHFLLKGSVKKTGAGPRGLLHIRGGHVPMGKGVMKGRVKSVAAEAMEAALRDFNSNFPSEKNNKKNSVVLDTVRGRSAFLQSVACLVLDETFADNLDNNPDLFAVNNGVFDSSSRDTVVFRNVEMTDNISRCAKGITREEDNYHLQRLQGELDDFLRKVMPVDEERDVVLAFFAGLLSGRRKEKKFPRLHRQDVRGQRQEHTYGPTGCPANLAVCAGAASHRALSSTGRSSIFDNLPVSMTEWKSGIADCANPLTEWLEEVVEMTGASSDAVWIGDLKVRWKESHYGEASVFSTKLVKAFFVGKQGTEWKETGRIDTKVKYGKSLQPLMWDMLAAGGNESCKELLNTFRVAYATGLIDYIRQMCGDDVCNPKQVGTVNVNYSSDIDVNLNFNGEILHNDLDRIVLIFKSIKDYHYQRFKRNFTDMFDINIYGSHFGMLNNPKSAKSKEEIYLISNDPQQRLFAMGKLAIMCKWSDREDMLKARDFIKKQPTYNSNNNEKLYTSYLKKYFAIDRNNTTTTTSRTGAVSGIVKVGRIFSMTKLLENDVYWSVGAFLHIVSGRKDLTESMYVDSMLDNTGFIVSNLRKKHVCKKEVSPYTTVLRVAKTQQKQTGSGLFSTKEVTSDKVLKELAKIPPGDLINRMNMNINTSLIKKTSTLDEQNAITHLVEIIETAMKQKDDFDKATRDFYTVYDKLKTAIFEACQTGPKLCGTVNGAIKTQKKNS
eukprot:gene9897-biopygen7092